MYKLLLLTATSGVAGAVASTAKDTTAKWLAGVAIKLFRTVAKCFDIIINFSQGTALPTISMNIQSIQNTLYTLVAVFMAFRIAISLLTYLIDPDKMEDKSVGGIKLISKIAISLILLLTMNSFIFPLFNKVQEALLGKDSILNNGKIFSEKSNYNDIKNTLSVNNPLIENVYAADSNTITCYYTKAGLANTSDEGVTKKAEELAQKLSVECPGNPNTFVSGISCNYDAANVTSAYDYFLTISKVYVQQNSATVESAKTIALTFSTSPITNGVEVDNVDGPIYVAPANSSSANSSVNFSQAAKWASENKSFLKNTISENTCPQSINFGNFGSDCFNAGDSNNLITTNKLVIHTKDNTGCYGYGSTDLNTSISNSVDDYSDPDLSPVYVDPDYQIEHDASKDFSMSILNSFVDGSSSNPISSEVLTSNTALKQAQNDIEDGKMELDAFGALLAGIICIVFMFVLCIEVVIRNLKLLLLEIVSPIAVMSYMNPNDKIFGQWWKQYIGTFASLFVQLLALKAGIYFLQLLKSSITNNYGGMYTLLIVLGTFLFMKAVPDMISKIFGLDAMGGTLKDSFGLVKKGLGIGAGVAAGAVAGGIAGAVTGFGSGGGFSTVAGGLLGGVTRGAIGGSKGKVFEGAKNQASRNKNVKATDRAGGNWWERQLSKFGMDSASRGDRKIKDLEGKQKAYEEFNKYKDEIDNIAESSNFMKNLRAEKDANGGSLYTEEELKNAKNNWIETQIDGNTRPFKIYDKKNQDHDISTIVETGKAASIKTILAKAEDTRRGNSTINSVASKSITNYSSLDTVNTEIRTARNDVEIEINKVKSTDDYQAGDAARQGSNSGKQ